MRIIGGQFRGRKLVHFNDGHIRPTMDRVKEALFNMWQFEIEGSHFLDLYSGSGSLGLEAISRGAAQVTFVDSHPRSLHILKQNLELLKVTSGFTIIKADVIQFLKRKQNQEQLFDFIVIDPPFTESLAHSTMEAFAQSALLKPSGSLAIESNQSERIDEDYGDWSRQTLREYGDKFLSLYQKASKVEA